MNLVVSVCWLDLTYLLWCDVVSGNMTRGRVCQYVKELGTLVELRTPCGEHMYDGDLRSIWYQKSTGFSFHFTWSSGVTYDASLEEVKSYRDPTPGKPTVVCFPRFPPPQDNTMKIFDFRQRLQRGETHLRDALLRLEATPRVTYRINDAGPWMDFGSLETNLTDVVSFRVQTNDKCFWAMVVRNHGDDGYESIAAPTYDKICTPGVYHTWKRFDLSFYGSGLHEISLSRVIGGVVNHVYGCTIRVA